MARKTKIRRRGSRRVRGTRRIRRIRRSRGTRGGIVINTDHIAEKLNQQTKAWEGAIRQRSQTIMNEFDKTLNSIGSIGSRVFKNQPPP